MELGLLTTHIMSVKEPFKTGTLMPLPFNLPESSGKILLIALAAPVVVGILTLQQLLPFLNLYEEHHEYFDHQCKRV